MIADRPPVQDVRRCPYCQSTLPVGHTCPAGAPVPCVEPVDGGTCGICPLCLAAQEAWLQRYGTPGDLAPTPEDTYLEGPR